MKIYTYYRLIGSKHWGFFFGLVTRCSSNMRWQWVVIYIFSSIYILLESVLYLPIEPDVKRQHEHAERSEQVHKRVLPVVCCLLLLLTRRPKTLQHVLCDRHLVCFRYFLNDLFGLFLSSFGEQPPNWFWEYASINKI